MVSSAVNANGRVVADSAYTTAKKTVDTVGKFSDIMAKSMSAGFGTNSSKSSVKDVGIQQTRKQEYEPDSVADDVKTDDDCAISKDTKDATETPDASEVKSLKAAEKVLDKISKELDISEEELKECMEVLGLSLMDLLQPGNILKLVVEATGTQDTMAIVTDEGLSEALKNILDYANELADGMGDMQTASEESSAAEGFIEGINTSETQTEGESLEDVIASKIVTDSENVKATYNALTDSNNSGDGSDMANHGKSETDDVKASDNSKTVDVSESIVSQLTGTFEAALDSQAQGVDAADVVRQVVDSIKFNNTQALKSIEVALNPENLGKVNIVVSVREGVVMAQIVTENEQVKKALENQVNTLKETLENQGVKVESVEVTVQTHEFENNQQFNDERNSDNSSKVRKKIKLDDINFDEEEDSQKEEQIVAHENSSVEYMA